jgi:hypothetical protein
MWPPPLVTKTPDRLYTPDTAISIHKEVRFIFTNPNSNPCNNQTPVTTPPPPQPHPGFQTRRDTSQSATANR